MNHNPIEYVDSYDINNKRVHLIHDYCIDSYSSFYSDTTSTSTSSSTS